jgi:hypothetical protein
MLGMSKLSMKEKPIRAYQTTPVDGRTVARETR